MKLSENTIYSNILTVFLILVTHVLLIGGIGVLVLFFYGIINHMVWMILGILGLFTGGYWFYRHLKSDMKALKDITGDSLKGKTVEVSFLGGVASFRITDSPVSQRIKRLPPGQPRQLAGQKPDNVKALAELAQMYEKKLITFDEYNRAKKKLL